MFVCDCVINVLSVPDHNASPIKFISGVVAMYTSSQNMCFNNSKIMLKA